MSLQFLRDKENEVKYIKNATAFFKLDATTKQDEVDKKNEEFIDEYYTSLDYVKSFKFFKGRFNFFYGWYIS